MAAVLRSGIGGAAIKCGNEAIKASDQKSRRGHKGVPAHAVGLEPLSYGTQTFNTQTQRYSMNLHDIANVVSSFGIVHRDY